MFRPGDFERLRARLDESPFRKILQAMVEREEKLGESAGDNSCLLYQLTGERRYLDQAVELAWKLANKTLEELNYKTNHGCAGFLRRMSIPLDYLWDELEPELRDLLQARLLERTQKFFPLTLARAHTLPGVLESHTINYGPPNMAHAILALYHHEPEAREWLQSLLRWLDYFPGADGWGGDDGGWGQGFGHGEHWATQQMMQQVYVATGIDYFQIPWARNNGNSLLYFQPPYGNCPNFGDSSYFRPKCLQRQVMDTWARTQQNPYCRWFADQLVDEPVEGFTPPYPFLLSQALYWEESPPSQGAR